MVTKVWSLNLGKYEKLLYRIQERSRGKMIYITTYYTLYILFESLSLSFYQRLYIDLVNTGEFTFISNWCDNFRHETRAYSSIQTNTCCRLFEKATYMHCIL